MAFLKNDNNKITIQAVLTDAGKAKMAAGSLNITKFKCFDDGVDYELYNTLHPQGSDYYDSAITNLPIIEPMAQSPVPLKYPKYWLNIGENPPTNGWKFKLNGWFASSITQEGIVAEITYSYSTTGSNLQYDTSRMAIVGIVTPTNQQISTGMQVSLIPTISTLVVPFNIDATLGIGTGLKNGNAVILAYGVGHSFKMTVRTPALEDCTIRLTSGLYILGTDNTWSLSNITTNDVTVIAREWTPSRPNYSGHTALGSPQSDGIA